MDFYQQGMQIITITCRQDYKRTFSSIANKIFNNSIYLLKLVSWAKLFKT